MLLGISEDTVRRWCESGRLDAGRDSSGRVVVEGASLAQFMTAQREVDGAGRARGDGTAVSARNRFNGLVTRVVRDSVMAQVELQSGPHRIVSLMSREAADELGLEVGVLAVASVKATNVVVEAHVSER